MNSKKIKLIFSILLSFLSACSTQPIQPEINTSSESDLTIIKSGKTLQLVRIMEGGVCKNKQQGAMGLFKLYASLHDITKIKQQQGATVFSDFEQHIQNFSMLALQHAVDQLKFTAYGSANPRLINKLSQLFVNFIAKDIAKFEIKNTLSINVIPVQDSLNIYFNDCQIPHAH